MKKLFSIYWIVAALALGGGLLAGGCADSDAVTDEVAAPESQFVVALVDEQYALDYAGPMKIRGLYFAQGDEIVLKQGDRTTAAASEREFVTVVRTITPTDITVAVGPDVTTGAWSLYCRRDGQTQYLGTTQLTVDILRLVRNVTLHEAYVLDKGDRMTIGGEGFAQGDRIVFSQPAAQAAHDAAIAAITDDGVTLQTPDGLTSGAWNITCRRGSDTQLLGEVTLTVTVFPFIDPATLPEGTNAYGRVYCGEQPLAGVYVSDGVELVRTDAQGVYAMVSTRACGTLFVSLPAGYEAPAEGCVPQFYALFEDDNDRYDFPLVQADQTSYVLLATADIQVNNDASKVVPQSSLKSCNDTFVPAYRQALAELAGRKVYNVSLGDMVYDKFWYSRRFGLPEYKELIGQFGVPFFHVMGNHDNDPYCADDFQAEHAFREELGPTYYSLNIGGVHYIALDNIRYINTGGAQGILGQTNYATEVSARQLAWLKKDLATVDPTTPIMVWMHAPLLNTRVASVTVNASFTNAAELAACFEGYQVHILSGHWHNNHRGTYPGKANIVEHNVGSVCGALWQDVPGFNGADQPFGAATDGTPQGFAVYEISGKQVRWLYRGCDTDVQFMAYDMNKQTYKDKTVANEVLVNVWDWDERWKVEVLESGRALMVKREVREDPNYLRFMATAYADSGEASKASSTPQKTPHMFSSVTAAADSPVEVKVTSAFGVVYTKQLRP